MVACGSVVSKNPIHKLFPPQRTWNDSQLPLWLGEKQTQISRPLGVLVGLGLTQGSTSSLEEHILAPGLGAPR